jgi:hypothetical protein
LLLLLLMLLLLLLLHPMCPSSHVLSGWVVSTVDAYTIGTPGKCRLIIPQHTRACNTIRRHTDAQ